MENKQRPRPFNSLLIPVLFLMLFVFVFAPMIRGSFSSGQDSYKLEDFQEDLKNGDVTEVTITPNRDNDTGYAMVTLKDNSRKILYATQLAEIEKIAREAGVTLHLRQLAGSNSHHIIEGCFKAFARALSAAVSIDEKNADRVPSTKGVLG